MNDWNPYAPTENSVAVPSMQDDEWASLLEPKDLKKIETIVHEGNQFWVVLGLSMFCSVLGLLIMVPWYTMRRWQWTKFAAKYPALLTPNRPLKSLPERFQKAKAKLDTCIIGGIVCSSIVILLLFLR